MSSESLTNNEKTTQEIYENLSYDDQMKVREYVVREKIKNMSLLDRKLATHEASQGLAEEWRGDGEDLFRYLSVYAEDNI